MRKDDLCKELCIAYAANRQELCGNKNRVSEIVDRNIDSEELFRRTNLARVEYYDIHSEWAGWKKCFVEFDLMVDPEFKELATLWDRQRELKKEIGIIKRKICAAGRKYLK